MKESSVYQYILKEGMEKGMAEGMEKGMAEGMAVGRLEGRKQGEVAEAKRVLRLIGEGAFGAPDTQTSAAIDSLSDLARLEHLLSRARGATSWDDLIGTGKRRMRKSRES